MASPKSWMPRMVPPAPSRLYACSDSEAVALLCAAGADLTYSVPSERHRKTSVLTAALLVEAPEPRSQIVHTLLQVRRGLVEVLQHGARLWRSMWLANCVPT